MKMKVNGIKIEDAGSGRTCSACGKKLEYNYEEESSTLDEIGLVYDLVWLSCPIYMTGKRGSRGHTNLLVARR